MKVSCIILLNAHVSIWSSCNMVAHPTSNVSLRHFLIKLDINGRIVPNWFICKVTQLDLSRVHNSIAEHASSGVPVKFNYTGKPVKYTLTCMNALFFIGVYSLSVTEKLSKF